MDEDDRLQLQRMIAANGTQDFTQEIRRTKHSKQIKEQVSLLLKCKRDYARLAKSRPDEFEKICLGRCGWLFDHYFDIYNRVFKDELNLDILHSLLTKLRQIEDGELDQHEASYHVGMILKEMYVDSALRKEDKLEKGREKHNKRRGIVEKKPKKISYAQYCAMMEANEASKVNEANEA
jgi:hypothetical protein